MTRAVLPVTILGGNRVPFARSNSCYAQAFNQDMLTATLDGLIARFGLASRHRLAAAYRRGFFDDLITPYLRLRRDKDLRPGPSGKKLATLKAWADADYCKRELSLETPPRAVDQTMLDMTGSSLAVGHPSCAIGGQGIAAPLRSS